MTDLAVVDTGDPNAPPIIWLGSLGSATAMWHRQVEFFGTSRRCVLVDHPGHGASPPADGPLSIEAIGADVLTALDRVGVERADFVGLSLGAMASMSIAAERPERVGRLALLCTSARFDSPGPWAERAATVRAEGTAAIAATVVGRWLTPEYAADNPDDVSMLEAMIGATDDESYAACCDAVGAMDLRPALPSIGAATVVVAGTKDPATPVPYGETIAAGIPGSRLELVASAHLSNWERSAEINDILAGHLGGSDGG